MKRVARPEIIMKKSFYISLFILTFVTIGCKRGTYSISRLDTLRVPANSYSDTCSKSIHIDNYNHRQYLRLSENNHYEDLLCSDDINHYRIVNEYQCIDLEVTANGNKSGRIHLTFVDTNKQGVSFEEQVIAWEIPLKDKAVDLAFEVIDSLRADSIYTTNTENISVGESIKSGCDFVYEFSTPNNYYLQFEPMCRFDDMLCRRWIKKLSVLESRINQILLPYRDPIEHLKQELKGKGIVKI